MSSRRTGLVVPLVASFLVAMLILPATGLAAINNNSWLTFTKTVDKTQLSAPGTVTYTYVATHNQDTQVHQVSISDDKVAASKITGPVMTGGNQDTELDPGEVWTWTAIVPLSQTTVNVATLSGRVDNSEVVVPLRSATATVTIASVTASSTTENGGEMPDTATPLYSILLLGTLLVLAGLAGVLAARRRSA